MIPTKTAPQRTTAQNISASTTPPNPTMTRRQKNELTRRRQYASKATPEQLQWMKRHLPEIDPQLIEADLEWCEYYLGTKKRETGYVRDALEREAAYHMAFGITRDSWVSICKVGPPSPERLNAQAERVRVRAAEVQLKHPETILKFALYKGPKDSRACESAELNNLLREGWNPCGFWVSKNDQCLYSEVVGPCTNPRGAPGCAEIIWALMSAGEFEQGNLAVLLPDGRIYDNNTNLAEVFSDLNGSRRGWDRIYDQHRLLWLL